MVVFVRSPLGIVVSALASIAVAAFIYFVIVKPETDKANETVKQSLQQAQPQFDRANRIQECIARAGGDPQKIAACQ
jgi:flagellar biosynthesis/type III secretory pathway M-ring protein FliF/YscJ